MHKNLVVPPPGYDPANYPPLNVHRPFFCDLLIGQTFFFCCDSEEDRKEWMKVAHDSYMSRTRGILPPGVDVCRSVRRISTEQSNSPVLITGLVGPDDFKILTDPCRAELARLQ